jgi:flagellar basal body rod protein FlgG
MFMDDLMIQATGLIARETRRVETAAQNVANSATPGYKRAIAFDAVLAAQTMPITTTDAPSAPELAIATDFSAGKLLHTGSPWDLALNGPGFFEVMTPSGPQYTRLGAFHRDEEGRLLTAQGWAVQASGGGDVLVHTDHAQIQADGTILEDGTPGQSVRVVQFADPTHLQRAGESLFAPGDQDARDSEQPTHLTANTLEASNVVGGSDMVQVMDAMRRVESGQKIVHAYDDMMGTVLQHLGDM